ncbi:MAG: serine/threonine-protein kinase [Polyangiales bacterium]
MLERPDDPLHLLRRRPPVRRHPVPPHRAARGQRPLRLAHRPLRGRAAPRRRRHGGRLQGPPRDAQPARGDQAPARGVRAARRHARALPPRGAGGGHGGQPHIIRVHDCGATARRAALPRDGLLEGEGLEAVLRRERRLSPPRAVALVTQVLDGLEAAHAAGIVHRDMKPANVFVRRTPDPATPEFVTVLDFGISKFTDPSGAPQQQITQTGTMIGTPVYMAPEQIMSPKEVDRRVDIYATGVMLYEMLAGRLPYDGANTAELIVKACTTPPTPLLEVAPDVPTRSSPSSSRRWPRGVAALPDGRGLRRRAPPLAGRRRLAPDGAAGLRGAGLGADRARDARHGRPRRAAARAAARGDAAAGHVRAVGRALGPNLLAGPHVPTMHAAPPPPAAAGGARPASR